MLYSICEFVGWTGDWWCYWITSYFFVTAVINFITEVLLQGQVVRYVPAQNTKMLLYLCCYRIFPYAALVKWLAKLIIGDRCNW